MKNNNIIDISDFVDVETSNADPRTQGMRKLNTPIAVRFL